MKIYAFKIDESFNKRLEEFQANLPANEKIVDTKAENGTYIIRTELKESVSGTLKKLLLG